MKIPRYEGVGSSKLDTGRSLTSGTSGTAATSGADGGGVSTGMAIAMAIVFG